MQKRHPRSVSTRRGALTGRTVADALEERVLRHGAEGRFRALIEKSADGIAMCTEAGAILYTSPAVSRMLGVGAEEVLGSTVFEWVHPDDLGNVARFFEQVARHPGACASIECRSRHADGSWRWMETTVTNLLEQPAVGAVVCNVRDVTERRRADEAVAQLAAIVESSSDAIFSAAADGTVATWNPAAARLYGYTAAEIIGRPVTVVIPPERMDRVDGVRQQIRQGGRVDSLETVGLRKDGSRVQLSVTISPMTDAGGTYVGTSIIARDISDRVRTQAALAEALRERENIMETIPDLLYTLDLEGRVIKWNHKAETASGFSAAEMDHRAVLDFFPAEDHGRILDGIASTFSAGYGEVEARLRHRDGTVVPYHFTGVPLRDESGVVIGMTGVGRDITERKRAEEQTQALLNVATLIVGTLDERELLERVQRETAKLLACDGVAVVRVDAERVGRVIAHCGLPGDLAAAVDGLEFPHGQPFGGRLAAGVAVVLNGLSAPAWLPEPLRSRLPIAGLVAAPLLVRGRELGALVAFNTDASRPFVPYQVDLVRCIGQQLAIAMDAAELYRVQQEEAEVSAALACVGRETIAMLETPALLDRLCELTTQLLRCDFSHTWLWEPDDDAYVAASQHGDPPEHWEALRTLKFSRPTIAPLLARLYDDELVDLSVFDMSGKPLGRLPSGMGITGALVVALRRGGDIVGLHTAGFRGRQQRFTTAQMRIARGIAHLGSLALQSARLVGELARADRLKSDFVATMSHELRTPLNIILGYNDLVLEGAFGRLNPDQADALERVDASARTLLELITATLDVSRLENGRVPLHHSEVDLRAIVHEVDVETRELREQKPRVQFHSTIAEPLPPFSTDALKLKVVLKNLIGNAVKFTEQGSVTLAVAAHDDGVEFCVADTGIGIAAHMQRLIFEPFRQADSSSTRQYGGVGLGLYIVRRLVEMLGGSIAVESSAGLGATFRVWLPDAGVAAGGGTLARLPSAPAA